MENVALVKELVVRLLEFETPAPKKEVTKLLSCEVCMKLRNRQKLNKRYDNWKRGRNGS